MGPHGDPGHWVIIYDVDPAAFALLIEALAQLGYDVVLRDIGEVILCPGGRGA